MKHEYVLFVAVGLMLLRRWWDGDLHMFDLICIAAAVYAFTKMWSAPEMPVKLLTLMT